MQGMTPAVNWSSSYAYDTLGRLATASRGAVSNWNTTPTLSTTNSSWDWSGTSGGIANLDLLGNWRQLSYGVPGSLLTDTRSHDAVNEISTRTCANKSNPTWDANGNLTLDGDSDAGPFGTKQANLRFVYDYRNRMTEVWNTASNVKIVSYVYDGLNRRVEKKLYSSGSDTRDTWYLWNGWQCLEECDHLSSDAVVREFVYGVGGLDDHMAMINPDGTTYYYLQDRLNHVIALAQAGATSCADRYVYEPYGRMTVTDDSGNAKTSAVGGGQGGNCLFGFTGQFFDGDVGLNYYKNRWYSPDMGRFTSKDPTGYRDGMNLYQYVRSMPLNGFDPYGLAWWASFCHAAVGVAEVVGGRRRGRDSCRNGSDRGRNRSWSGGDAGRTFDGRRGCCYLGRSSDISGNGYEASTSRSAHRFIRIE